MLDRSKYLCAGVETAELADPTAMTDVIRL